MDKIKIGLICLAVGALAGYMLRPEPEIKIKEVVKVEKQVDEKVVVVERPDGTKTTTINRKSHTKDSRVASKEKKNPQKDWLLGAQKGLVGTDSWGASAHRRILGDIYLGGLVDDRGNVMLSIQLLF